MILRFLCILVISLSSAIASELRAEPMSLKVFNENFHLNAFCKVFTDMPDESQPDRIKDVLTGEIVFLDKSAETDMTMMNSRGRTVRYDATRGDKSSCSRGDMEWTNIVDDESEWLQLVQRELQRVNEVPSEQHSWIATVWPHVVVDSTYTGMLAKHLQLPHHHDVDEEGTKTTEFLHSAFSHFVRINNVSGTATNPGFFVLPMDGRMVQFAQDQSLFEHLFPLPAVFKLSPSVRVYMDHHGRDENVVTDGGEHLDITLTPVANGISIDDIENATAIADEWNGKLKDELTASGLHFISEARHIVTLEREDEKHHEPAHIDSITQWLLQDGRVAHVELRPHYRTANAYAAWVTQVNPPEQTDRTKLGTPIFPIHQKGITGQGQIVGVGDSGLDYTSCFFKDANSPLTRNDIGQGRNARPYNGPNHRKVIQYVGYADNHAGQLADHGTHVAGSVAGSLDAGSTGPPQGENTGPNYHGSAPDAKIAFFDIGLPNARTLTVPASLRQTMFPPAKDAGAFIHTNSWGSIANQYNNYARDMDSYQFSNQDFLILVAAGNSGPNPSTVGAPATAKNIVGVGASVAPKASFFDSAVGTFTTPQQAIQFSKMEDSMASFSSSGPTYDRRQQPVVSAPGFFISSANSQVDQTGNTPGVCTVVALRGTSMATPIVAGNVALLRQYYVEGWYPTGTKRSDNSRVPTGALLKAALVNGARVVTNPDTIQQSLSRAGAPKSKETIGLPDTVQGQGIITLTHSMHFDDTEFETLVMAGFCPLTGSCTEANFANMETVDNGGTKSYTIELTGSSALDLNITLAWSDPPASPQSQNAALLNNLDLKVTAGDGTVYLPVNPLTGQQEPNTLDTVEKVIIPRSVLNGMTSVSVEISGTSVTQGPQPFALIAGGPIKKKVAVPPGDIIVEEIESVVNNAGENGNPILSSFLKKETGAFVGMVVGLVIALILTVVLVVVLTYMDNKKEDLTKSIWLFLARPDSGVNCNQYFLMGLRVAVLITCIAAFIIGGIEQGNIEKLVPTATFGTFWQQYMVLAVGIIAILVSIAGFVLNFAQVKGLAMDEPTTSPLYNKVMMVIDFVVALLALVASIGAASVGNTTYLFLRQALAALIIMLFQLIATIVDAAQGLSVDHDNEAPKLAKPTSDKRNLNGTIAYKPQEKRAVIQATSDYKRRNVPKPPSQPQKTRPKSVRGEILVALYDYEGQEDDELNFQEGDRIELQTDHQDGWGFGFLVESREQGLFPISYTERENNAVPPPPPKTERV